MSQKLVKVSNTFIKIRIHGELHLLFKISMIKIFIKIMWNIKVTQVAYSADKSKQFLYRTGGKRGRNQNDPLLFPNIEEK